MLLKVTVPVVPSHIGDGGIGQARAVGGVASPPNASDHAVAGGGGDLSGADQVVVLVEIPVKVGGGNASFIQQELTGVIVNGAIDIMLGGIGVDDGLSAHQGGGLTHDLTVQTIIGNTFLDTVVVVSVAVPVAV